jgi:hypothetical protein
VAQIANQCHERIPDLMDFGRTAAEQEGTLAEVKARFLNGIRAKRWTRRLIARPTRIDLREWRRKQREGQHEAGPVSRAPARKGA